MTTVNPMPVILPAGPAVAVPGTAPAMYNFQPGIRNTESVGVFLDKIVLTGLVTAGSARNWISSLYIDVRWHNELITHGMVALDAVAWPQNRFGETAGAPAGGFTPVPQGARSLVFSQPIYLDPGDYLTVTVSGMDGAIDDNMIAALAIGRQTTAPPEPRFLPFLCDYVGPVYEIDSDDPISDQSTPADLLNPFDRAMFIERMIGRVACRATVGGVAGRQYIDFEPSAMWGDFRFRVSDHRDNFWVADPTPLPLVCNASDRSWILRHLMEPKGFLRVEFEGVMETPEPAPDATHARALLGLVGYRRIET